MRFTNQAAESAENATQAPRRTTFQCVGNKVAPVFCLLLTGKPLARGEWPLAAQRMSDVLEIAGDYPGEWAVDAPATSERGFILFNVEPSYEHRYARHEDHWRRFHQLMTAMQRIGMLLNAKIFLEELAP
jgi:hypothetical protein